MSRQVKVGGVAIGGGAPVTVQSMLSVPSVSYTHLTLPTILRV